MNLVIEAGRREAILGIGGTLFFSLTLSLPIECKRLGTREWGNLDERYGCGRVWWGWGRGIAMNTINRRCMRTFAGYVCFILYTALEKPLPPSVWQQERHRSIAFLIQHSDNGSFAATLRLAKLPTSVSSCKLNPPLPLLFCHYRHQK